MASKPGALYEFPWQPLGNWKLALLLPFAAVVLSEADDADNWSWHMCMLVVLRYAHAALWNSLSRLHAVSAATRITAKPVEFKQVDREVRAPGGAARWQVWRRPGGGGRWRAPRRGGRECAGGPRS